VPFKHPILIQISFNSYTVGYSNQEVLEPFSKNLWVSREPYNSFKWSQLSNNIVKTVVIFHFGFENHGLFNLSN